MKNQKGFTLIEMLIVLMIISVLLIITIPNMTKHNDNINKKGCAAYVKMVQAQVHAFEMDKNKYPISIQELETEGYVTSVNSTCGKDKQISISSTGEVSLTTPPTTTE
ncbi:competence type IV pilus major pilin ComGC [Bacillus sp. CGMCC 1.16607]|uniref:competence type IV pilus major pilin ComGC n=1 Tax=Bacillus sp. CGMCC 1.16607 TaxID=3351842 RepID=UPI00362723C0